jgi:hypothetical protein
MVFFSDTWTKTADIVAMTNLIPDINNGKIGRYNWITPDLYNEMHSALSGGFTYHGTHYTGDQSAVAAGDNCLSILIPQIMSTTAYSDHGLIIIRMDESEGGDTTSYTLLEIIISPLAKGNAYASSVVMSHSSDLKTTEEIFGLSYVNNTIPSSETTVTGSGYNTVVAANDLSDLFQPVSEIAVQQPAGNGLTNGVSAVAFGTAALGSSVTNLFTVTNSGNAALNLTNIVVTGANAGDFAVKGITLPASIAASAATTFNVVFSPSSSGARSATLQITNNDSSHNPFTVTLAGTGLVAPVLVSGQAGGGGVFQLGFTGPAGQTYHVLTTENLAVPLTNWAVLGGGTFSNTTVLFTDSNATNYPDRFYSIKSP